jgi:hypothetical protein
MLEHNIRFAASAEMTSTERGRVLLKRGRLLCCIVALCVLGRPIRGEEDVRSAEKQSWLDNGHLPTGTRAAIIVSGLCRRGVLEHALASLQAHVVGQTGGAHIFVHTEPSDPSFAVDEVRETLARNLARSSLKGFVISHPTRRELSTTTSNWTMPAIKHTQVGGPVPGRNDFV